MKLVILDRDGVINEDSDAFIKAPDEWEAIPGSLKAIAQLSNSGFNIIVATNQSGLGRNLFDMNTLNLIHQKMLSCVEESGGKITRIYFCPHHPNDNCDCRKPKPGLFLKIASDLAINLKNTYAVGDSLRDLQAAVQAGAKPVLVKTGKGLTTFNSTEFKILCDSDPALNIPVYNNLLNFTNELLKKSDLEH